MLSYPWYNFKFQHTQNIVFKNELVPPFNCQVGVQTSQVQVLPTDTELRSWETFNEDIALADGDKTITIVGLLEQLNITRDTSDYLWYTTR